MVGLAILAAAGLGFLFGALWAYGLGLKHGLGIPKPLTREEARASVERRHEEIGWAVARKMMRRNRDRDIL